jgi:UDP-N-acetylglucosamine--N-acetylmuramyl-(pentapeptide) pyrophosphoryl-undecaprenol N-acetylglucosamine transferase
VSGTPIRSFDGIDRAAARAALGVGADDRLMLVFGGSQAVTTLNRALEGALPALVDDWRILHVAGAGGLADAQRARDGLDQRLRDRYAPEAFLTDAMAPALVAADLVVGRAGSSTCAEVAATGTPSILVPYPHAGSHQDANAAWLGDQGAAVVIADEAFTGERLISEAHRLRDDAVRLPMAEAARRLGRPHAARALAAELLAMATGAPLPSEAEAAT